MHSHSIHSHLFSILWFSMDVKSRIAPDLRVDHLSLWFFGGAELKYLWWSIFQISLINTFCLDRLSSTVIFLTTYFKHLWTNYCSNRCPGFTQCSGLTLLIELVPEAALWAVRHSRILWHKPEVEQGHWSSNSQMGTLLFGSLQNVGPLLTTPNFKLWRKNN